MGKKNLKIIAFDTSTANTGYAVYENPTGVQDNRTDWKLTKFGSFDNRKIRDTFEKHLKTKDDILSLIKSEKPDMVVVELTCVPRNMTVGRILERILGIVEYYCEKHDIGFYEMRPTSWRKYAKGETKVPARRDDLKKWSVDRVMGLFGIEVNDDISDAILIGFGFLNFITEGGEDDE